MELLKSIKHGSIESLDIHSQGEKVLCGTSEGKIVVLNFNSPQDNKVIFAHASRITCVKFSPAGNQIASSSLDNKIKLWTSENDDQPIVFDGQSWVWSVAFNPDGSRLISGAKDKTVRMYVINKQDLVAKIKSKVLRNFTTSEWNKFVGTDIPYEKTIDN